MVCRLTRLGGWGRVIRHPLEFADEMLLLTHLVGTDDDEREQGEKHGHGIADSQVDQRAAQYREDRGQTVHGEHGDLDSHADTKLPDRYDTQQLVVNVLVVRAEDLLSPHLAPENRQGGVGDGKGEND